MKTRLALTLVLVLLAVLVVVDITDGLRHLPDLRSPTRWPTATLAPRRYAVEYRVTAGPGMARADVTYTNAGGGTEQAGVTLPWSLTFESGPGAFVYIAAQSRYESGAITVSIHLNGRQLKTSTSNGAYVIAMASDRL